MRERRHLINQISEHESKAAGEHFLADVRIGKDEMAEGSSEKGTVYFTVSGSDYVFDEVHCEAYNLPTKEITIDVRTSIVISFVGRLYASQ